MEYKINHKERDYAKSFKEWETESVKTYWEAEAYWKKYDRLYNYDESVCGQYVIPKSECDAELMALILDFLSDNEVQFGDNACEYMLMSSPQPFYDDDDNEYWVDCWIISDQFTI